MRNTLFSFAAALGFVSVHAQNDGAPPFAAKVESVTFFNYPVRLSGAFLKPESAGPFPAVAIVHGAGPATHDEPAFRVHANSFVDGGFAVLLYDKRGSGKSTGSLDTSDYDDLAADLDAAVRYLRSRADILPDQIGILGRSEGGWIGTLAASRDSSIRFVILSSGSGVRPSTQTLFATRRSLRGMGASETEIEEATSAKSELWSYYAQLAKMDSAAKRSAATLKMRDDLESRLRSFSRFTPEIPQSVRNPAITPPIFFQAFTRKIEYDPMPAFRTTNAALLVVIGENDEVVDPPSTVEIFKELKESGCDVTVRMLSDVGHSLVLMTNEGPRYPDDYPEFAVRWARNVINTVRHK